MKKRIDSSYPLYFAAAAKAYEVLCAVGIDSLPVDLERICKHYNIKVYSCSVATEIIELFELQNFCKTNDSFCFSPDDKTNLILINDKLGEKEQRLLIAHEIGHILMGHLGMFKYGTTSDMEHYYEMEAEAFAVSLLAPFPVLAELNMLNSHIIASLCNLPWYVARSVHSKLNSISYIKEYFRLRAYFRELLDTFGNFILQQTEEKADDKASSASINIIYISSLLSNPN